jgi:DNA-binding MarR family transcriptional regulator
MTTADIPDLPSVQEQLLTAQKRSPLLARPGFLIRRLHQLHCALFTEEARDFGITPVQYSLMTALDERGELDQNSLALEIGLERTTVADVVLRLHDRGVLERRQSAMDGRVRLVKLTRKGKTLLRKMAPAVQRAHDRTVEHLPPAERDAFLLQMVKLVELNNDISNVPLRLP